MKVLYRTFCLFIFVLSLSQTGVLYSQELPGDLPTYSICLENLKEGGEKSPHLIQLLEFHELDIVGSKDGIFTETEEIKNNENSLLMGKESSDINGVFYNPEKFELLDHSRFNIGPPNGNPERDRKNTRTSCSWGKLRSIEDGRLFYVFNVHASQEHDSSIDAKKVILEKIQQINQEGLPYILTGGFNQVNSNFPGINAIPIPSTPEG